MSTSDLIIDFHAHVFPRSPKATELLTHGPLAEARNRARRWMRPFSKALHKAQTMLRYFPEPIRKGLDEMAAAAPLPGLLVELFPEDLLVGMQEAGASYAVIIAHPPVIANEFVLELAEADSRFIPVVNLAHGIPDPGKKLRSYFKRGAKALKIHPAADGEGPGSRRYRSLIKVATDLGLPVIIHTGCIHTHILYKSPDASRAELFEPWFKEFPSTRFVLAHMNYHEPQIAMDLMESHPNVYADTSWQPAEVIAEAVRRVGAERILYGTDWPFVGGNIEVGIRRISDCVESGFLREAQTKLILGENARRLLGLSQDLDRSGSA